MNWVSRFKSLPVSTKRLLSAGVILAFAAALPLFVWGVIFGNFNLSKRASSAEPGTCVPVGNTITVTPNSDIFGTCHNIQAAIDAVNGDGYTIKIMPGVYDVSSKIHIDGKSNLSITGDENGSVGAVTINRNNDFGILIENSSGSIRWFTLQGGSGNGMLSISNSNNFAVRHANLNSQSSHTLDIRGSSNIDISETEIQSSAGALEVSGSSQIRILNNKIHNSDNAISLDNVDSVQITGNLIYTNNESGIRTNNIVTNASIYHNTLINNAKDGRSFPAILLGTNHSTFTISHNIIAFNHGAGVTLTGSEITSSFNHNDFWSNYINYENIANQTGINGNISADPLVTTNVDYCLNPGSPAIYGNYVNGEYMGATWPCGTYPTQAPFPTPSSSPYAVSTTPPATSTPTPYAVPTSSSTPAPYPSPTAASTPPPPTVRPFKILFRLQGVNGDAASFEKLGNSVARVGIKFSSPSLSYDSGFITDYPQPAVYQHDNVYAVYTGIWSADLPPYDNYSISLKGEKHLMVRFCEPSGQTEHCSGQGHISLPSNPSTFVNLDFTGIPLPPGDLPPQDGSVSFVGPNSDMTRLLQLLAKPPSTLSDYDRYVGDLDYNKIIDIRDLYLLRQALFIRYDEY